MENLLRIGRLKEHSAHQDELQRLLTAARRNLDDARERRVSPETRFDAAYKSIMQTALAALMASGFRPNTNQPGHHATVLQTQPKTVGMTASRMHVLDALRRKRNASDYTGAEIDDGSVDTCRHEARELLQPVENWLARHHAGPPGMQVASRTFSFAFKDTNIEVMEIAARLKVTHGPGHRPAPEGARNGPGVSRVSLVSWPGLFQGVHGDARWPQLMERLGLTE